MKYIIILTFILIRQKMYCLNIERTGVNAREGQLPWHVYLFVHSRNGDYSCTGTLLTNIWVVTAGRCLADKNIVGIFAKIGSPNFNIFGADPMARVIKCEKYITHENYLLGRLEDDIGLVKLDKPVALSTKIKTIAIGQFYNTTEVYSIGWNRVYNLNQLSSDLLYSKVKCSENSSYCSNLTNVLCCNLEQNSSKEFRGDVGGPLVIRNSNMQCILVGIGSFSRLPQKSSYISFIRTEPYLPWIIEKLSSE